MTNPDATLARRHLLPRWRVGARTKGQSHLFFAEHLLDRYVAHGIPAQRRRFDSDALVAAAWGRLQAGTFDARDMALLRHEAAEAWYLRRHRCGYTEAHEAAQRRYPSPMLAEDS